jgi:hypothetical protein
MVKRIEDVGQNKLIKMNEINYVEDYYYSKQCYCDYE